MIVPMKRLAVLCLTADRDHTLEVLADLGVVHISLTAVPEGPHIEKAQHEASRIRRVIRDLQPMAGQPPSGQTPEETIEIVWGSIRRQRLLRQELGELRDERKRIAPIGSFDPALVEELAGKGIVVRLFSAHPKDEVAIPDGFSRVDLDKTSKAVCFAVVGQGQAAISDATEIAIPKHSLAEIEASIQRLDVELTEEREKVQRYGGDYDGVRQALGHAETHLRLLEAKTSMGRSGPVSYLRGYVPAEAEPEIQDAAAHHGWAVLFEDPTPDENAPTLIRNPNWVRPIQHIFEFISIVPGYREVDISALFLVFFSLFFAMIVGDAGYGAIFLSAAVLGRAFLPKVPKTLWSLLILMSLCTIVWGLLTGVVFGLDAIPAALSKARVPWLTNSDNLMLVCFLIGAIHITIAHGWNAIRFINHPKALSQLGWICTTWVMFFTARTMVLGKPFPPIMMWVLGLGVVLILLFMTPLAKLKSEWFNHVMFPLNLISNFVDVVSYVRLFAVGMATFAMASAFNQMSGEMGGIGGFFLLLLGHTLNIALASMGVLVHGIRLNTLEFSGHLGQEWTGVKYSPFARKSPGTT